jgi:hypothetical protein
MITVELQVHDEKWFEEIVEFLWSEIVMRQPRFTTIERNTGSRLNLLELRSLVLQLGHAHADQTTGFEDPSYLLDQSTDLGQSRVMYDLNRQDSSEENISKR